MRNLARKFEASAYGPQTNARFIKLVNKPQLYEVAECQFKVALVSGQLRRPERRHVAFNAISPIAIPAKPAANGQRLHTQQPRCFRDGVVPYTQRDNFRGLVRRVRHVIHDTG